jgi:tRNA(fMet)-specific endonuclease VapC
VKYTLDSNACISHLRPRGNTKVTAQLARKHPMDVTICSVVRGELLYGAIRSNDVPGNMAKVNAFLAHFTSLPFDDAAAIHYAEIRGDLAKAGTPIGPNDLMIAAIARANGLTIVTHNTSEFSRVQGLAIEDWEMMA